MSDTSTAESISTSSRDRDRKNRNSSPSSSLPLKKRAWTMPSGSGAETPCKKVVNASVTSGETLRLSTNDAAFVVNSGSFDKSKVSISSENDECFPAAMARTFSKLTPLEIDSEASKNAEVKKPVKSETDKSGKGVESAKAKKAKQHIFVIKGCKTFPEKVN